MWEENKWAYRMNENISKYMNQCKRCEVPFIKNYSSTQVIDMP